jgi:hypothetical protein
MVIMQLVQMIADKYVTIIHFAMSGKAIATQDFTEVSGLIDAIHAQLDITVRI